MVGSSLDLEGNFNTHVGGSGYALRGFYGTNIEVIELRTIRTGYIS